MFHHYSNVTQPCIICIIYAYVHQPFLLHPVQLSSAVEDWPLPTVHTLQPHVGEWILSVDLYMGMKEGKRAKNCEKDSHDRVSLNHLFSLRCFNPDVCGHTAQTQTHKHLSCCREGGSLLQQESCYFLMTLTGGEVERGVAGGGGSIG